MSELITVLTPTYNRKDTLFGLYDSLLQQSVDERFIWFIADDGSTDGTKELFKEWDSRKEEREKFSILYRWYENGGKHRAINRAMKEIETELTFIVDSDDTLTADAILTISKAYECAREKHIENLCGFSFQRMTRDGFLMCRKVARDGMLGTYCGERVNKRNPGDMAEVWFTDILRKFPFPEYEGENFLGEDTVWICMSGRIGFNFLTSLFTFRDIWKEV